MITALKGPASWNDAWNECLALGMDLPVVLSQSHNVAAVGTHWIWLGAADLEEEGDWKWIDGSRMVFERWAGGQPYTWYGRGLPCDVSWSRVLDYSNGAGSENVILANDTG